MNEDTIRRVERELARLRTEIALLRKELDTEGRLEYVTVNELCRRFSLSRPSFYRLRKTDLKAFENDIGIRVPGPDGVLRVSPTLFLAWLRKRGRRNNG